jgi:hypothetical protein
MSLLWTLIGILVVIIWVITLVDLFRHPRGAGRTLLWVVLILILPFIGAVLYWALREPTAQEVENARITGGDVRPPYGRDIKP